VEDFHPMLRRFTMLCAAAALAGTLAFAQPMGPRSSPPNPTAIITVRVNQLAAQLNLTDAQKASAITIFTTEYTAAQPVQASLRTGRQSLAKAVKANDAGTISSMSSAIGGLEGQLTLINSTAEATFYAILTPAQQTLWDAVPHGGPGGRGGRGGPGGGMMGPGMMGNGMRGGPPPQ
jgi:Spy/CpxP family protein refolding chaperone